MFPVTHYHPQNVYFKEGTIRMTPDHCRASGNEEELEGIEHPLCHCPSVFKRRHRILGEPMISWWKSFYL